MDMIKKFTAIVMLVIASVAFGQQWTGKYQMAFDPDDPNSFLLQIVPDMDGKDYFGSGSAFEIVIDKNLDFNDFTFTNTGGYNTTGTWVVNLLTDGTGYTPDEFCGLYINIWITGITNPNTMMDAYAGVPITFMKVTYNGPSECIVGSGARFYEFIERIYEDDACPAYTQDGSISNSLQIGSNSNALTGVINDHNNPLTCNGGGGSETCGLAVPGDAFGWYEGSPVGSEITHSFTQPGTNAGFTLDINYLDNSFNMIINGTPLATAELEFQSNSTPGINIEFEDGTQYQTNTPAIWQMNKAYADDPLLDPHDAPVVIRVIISPAGEVSMFGWKGDAGDMTLYPLKLKTGPGTYEPATFNTIPWNQTSTNEITVSQRVISVTSMYGTGYGMNYAPCDCEKPSIATGDVLDTKVGISALGRDAMDRTENNWPEVRKGGWIALESHTKGFVPNRLSDAERDTIPSADLRSGMMIYNTDSDCIQINVDGTATGWHCFNEPGCPDVIRL